MKKRGVLVSFACAAVLLLGAMPAGAQEWRQFEDTEIGITFRLPEGWHIRAEGYIPRTYSIRPYDTRDDMIILQFMPQAVLFSGSAGIEDVRRLLVHPEDEGFLSARIVRIAGTSAVYARYAFSSAGGDSFRKDFVHLLYRDYVVSGGFIVETSRYGVFLSTVMGILETMRFNDISIGMPLIAGFS